MYIIYVHYYFVYMYIIKGMEEVETRWKVQTAGVDFLNFCGISLCNLWIISRNCGVVFTDWFTIKNLWSSLCKYGNAKRVTTPCEYFIYKTHVPSMRTTRNFNHMYISKSLWKLMKEENCMKLIWLIHRPI